MGFNEVYQSLQELFPQIDARALRAVAIEHWKDADAAAEAVLEEIIPLFHERSTPSSPLNQSISVSKSSEGSAGLQNNCNFNSGNQQSSHSDEPNEPFCYAHHDKEELTLSEKKHESGMKMSADVHSRSEPVVLLDLNMVGTLPIEISGGPETETEETISGDKFSESSIRIPSDRIHQHTVQDVDMGVDQIVNLVQKAEDIAGQLEIDFDNKENDVTGGRLESSAQLVEVPDTHESNLEKLEVSLSTDKPGYESTLNAAVSQYSQTHIMDVVEEIIEEARDNKQTLFTAMESVISLMRQVELKEQAVKEAKEETMVGGKSILDKVEELKQMLQHAKEANDMHAGEVYGEKAILGTEFRELQSRVLSLSDGRDKSLAVLDEMRKTLETRLAAAENEIRSAQQEKLEKEKAAQKLLADQELIMEKVVQESKILKQQAEDNAKLQEFLVDRGRIVDMLQGEIAVICQDVRVLKEKFDQHVPFSKSLFSSQTSFILASSNSKSLNTDQVELVPVGDDELFETQKKGDHEQVSEEKSDGDCRKALVDDGWDFFDEREINA